MAEELFQIGEVAKLYHVSVGTLRHCEDDCISADPEQYVTEIRIPVRS